VESFREVWATEDWKILHGTYKGFSVIAPRDIVLFALKIDLGEIGQGVLAISIDGYIDPFPEFVRA
jgi:hypothetical protein